MSLDHDRVADVVREQHARQPFSGVVEVRRRGRPLYTGAFGSANRAADVANTTRTRFGTASGTKTFTAVAVCQLIEAGSLLLDTRLHEAVDVALPGFDTDITIHHLLTHTSGGPDYFDEDELDAQADFSAAFGDIPLDRVRSPADIVPLFAEKPMKARPGASFHYNNGGYVLLGLVIERASGMAYADYIEKHVFARAGMGDAGFFEVDRLPPRTALGYLPDGRDNGTELTIKGLPDGGAYVTAADMGAFWDALFGGRLLGPAMVERLLRPHTAVGATEGDGTYYGYGLWLTVEQGIVADYTCSGADPGVAFVAAVFPDRRVDATVLGNTDADAWPLFAAIKHLVLDEHSPCADLTV